MTTNISSEMISDYHGRDSRTLGSTRISDFLRHGAPWWHQRYVAGTIPAPDPSDAMRQGSLLDCMLTEPSSFPSRYIVKPDGMSFATKEGKAWRDAAGSREIVPAEWVAIAEDGVKAAGDHRTASDMLNTPGVLAQPVLRRELGNGLTLQARPDWLHLNASDKSGWYIDLKKTDDLEGFGRKAIDYGYHRQLSLCQWLASHAGFRIDAYILAIEWQRGSRARLYRMPDGVLAAGWLEVRAVVDEIADRHATGDWSDDHDGGIDELEIPGWMLAKMEVAP